MTDAQMPESLKVVAYLTTDEEDSPAMLFFNQQEAGNYCALDEQPQELVLRSDFEAALQSALKDRDAEIERLEAAIRDYHYALDLRQHGGVAQDRAFNAICQALGMHWVQGEEKERRAAIDSTKGTS